MTPRTANATAMRVERRVRLYIGFFFVVIVVIMILAVSAIGIRAWVPYADGWPRLLEGLQRPMNAR